MSLVYTFVVPHPPLIIPEIGRGEELLIKDTIKAYKKVAKIIGEIKPDTIILSSPHSSYYTDYFYIAGGKRGQGDFSSFGVPEVYMDKEYDTDMVSEILNESLRAGMPVTKENSSGYDPLDHGVMVPLYFVNKEFEDYKLVKVSLSGLSLDDHYKFGEVIRKAIDNSGKKVVIIASGDLSHVLKADGPYGFKKEGPLFDEIVIDALRKGNFKRLMNLGSSFCEKAAECGLRSFVIMAGAIGEDKVEAELLSYEGPFGVGYGVASYRIFAKVNPYVKLARESLEHFLEKKEYMKVPNGLPVNMYERRAGVFVSYKMDGDLRGCMGTIEGVTSSVAEEVIRNSVMAGVRDPRFYPIRSDELSSLSVSVDVLGDSFVVEDRGTLDASRYGVIVSTGDRRGLLLPDLEGVDTPEEQISIALSKAGIGSGEDYMLEAFEVIRYRENI